MRFYESEYPEKGELVMVFEIYYTGLSKKFIIKWMLCLLRRIR